MRFLIGVFWNGRERRLRAAWRLTIHLVSLVAALFVVVSPLVYALLVVRQRTGISEEKLNTLFLTIGGMAQALVVFTVTIACCYWPDRRRPKTIGLRMDRTGELLFGIGLGGGLMIAVFTFEFALGWIEIVRVGPADGSATIRMLVMQLFYLALMIAVGVSEEIFSRGYHMQNLASGLAWLGRVPAVLVAAFVSSILFGLLHAGNDNADLISTLAIVFAGIGFAVGRVTTGNLAAPIGLHFSWNFVQGPILGFPVSGNRVPDTLIQIKQQGPTWFTGGEFGPEAGVIGWTAIAIEIAAFILLLQRSPSPRARLRRHVVMLTRY